MFEQPYEPHEELQRRSRSDERMDRIIGNLLRVGVMLAAVVVLAGGMVYLAREGRQGVPDLRNWNEHSEPAELRNLDGILHQSAALSGRGLIMLGLLLLIATPVARVVFSVVAFALQRDYLYVIFTLLVLAVLFYSLLSGYLSEPR